MAKILLGDDDEMNRDMLGRRLERRRYAVAHTVNGQRALTIIKVQKFDVILLEIMMPEVSGLAVLQSLRQRYSMPNLPVTMATVKDQSSDIVEALKLGANGYATKPFHHLLLLGPRGGHTEAGAPAGHHLTRDASGRGPRDHPEPSCRRPHGWSHLRHRHPSVLGPRTI